MHAGLGSGIGLLKYLRQAKSSTSFHNSSSDVTAAFSQGFENGLLSISYMYK